MTVTTSVSTSSLGLRSAAFTTWLGSDPDGVGRRAEWSESGQGRPIVFLPGRAAGSLLEAAVRHGVDGLGRTFTIHQLADPPERGPYLLDAWFAAVGDPDDLTLVLHEQAAVDGLAWARNHGDRVRAVVLIDPVIRPHSRRELVTEGVASAGQDTVRENAAWLSSSHVPKALFSTTDADSQSAGSTASWAAANVRNLTIETLDLAAGSRDDFGRSVRGWLRHISW